MNLESGTAQACRSILKTAVTLNVFWDEGAFAGKYFLHR
jgi:hypothetical protein